MPRHPPINCAGGARRALAFENAGGALRLHVLCHERAGPSFPASVDRARPHSSGRNCVVSDHASLRLPRRSPAREVSAGRLGAAIRRAGANRLFPIAHSDVVQWVRMVMLREVEGFGDGCGGGGEWVGWSLHGFGMIEGFGIF